MSISWKTEEGSVSVSNEVIKRLAGVAAIDCEGLAGMASRAQVKDGFAELLGLENLSKGVEVNDVTDSVSVDLHIVVQYGHNITEVARAVQGKVANALYDALGLQVSEVNVYVQAVRQPAQLVKQA